ncbi:dynein axonemal heavy chain 7-like [Pectinophora gossypiella]|uniref:dynein axonemal heavy chain 7-like n=1 Tax=Pectinophora gossypiella TaxID=13191 RepID=UPI00214E10D1|nr:dynein axonemal heavy chain 7-like [Pectinophora gossypiella]
MKKTEKHQSTRKKPGMPSTSKSMSRPPTGILIPKIKMPADFMIRTEPLFSLPPEIVQLPAPTSRAAKLQAAKTAIAPKLRRPGLMQSYTEMRKKREDFRATLMNLICQSAPEDCEEAEASEEENKRRYYFYLKYGLDTIHVAPLDNKIILKVHNLIATHLKKWKTTLFSCIDEMREDFMMSMKKAIVDFILNDPNKVCAISKLNLILDQSLLSKDEAWRDRYVAAKTYLFKNLHTVNPCIAQVLQIWWKQFNDLRLISMRDIMTTREPYELQDFSFICKRHIEAAGNVLALQWIPTIQAVFLQGSKRKHIPEPKQVRKMKHFYDCLGCIMTYNLQSLCLKSMKEFTEYILDVGGMNQGFIINLVYKDNKIDFDPEFKKFKESISLLYDIQIDTCQQSPRLETQLYQDFIATSRISLRPIVEDEIVNRYRKQIFDLINEHAVICEQRIADFDTYVCLLDGRSDKEVDAFINSRPEKTFDQYCAESIRYVELAKEIIMVLESTLYIGMFRLQRADLIALLRAAATKLANTLLKKMTDDYQAKIKGIHEEYKSIADKLLSQPPDTAALMDLIAYCKKVEDTLFSEMEDKLRDAMKYICFLGDYTIFSPQELKANNQAYHWYSRLPNVIEECKATIDIKNVEYQELLKVKIAKFIEDLDLYETQLEEFQYWGDIVELPEYVDKAHALDEQLCYGLTRIDQFNEEEASFGYELSQYPKRKMVYDKLTPFKKLYDAGYEFLDKHDKWMGAKVGSYEPEDIEGDVTYYYKIVYKLEKSFAEVPDTLNLAVNIRERMDKFKTHMPIIQTLGNPGMKPRHWEKISDIVGFPIVVDDDLSLKKVIDFGLDDYIDKFESISEAATKENNLERTMDKMMKEWQDLRFEILPYKETGTYILSSVDEIQLLLDDHIVKTQTMKNSPYIKPFEEMILDWEGKLVLLQEILDEWLKVQATWMYLEPIFASPDIQQQIPEEGRRFSAVDKMWKDIMKTSYTEPRVLDVITIEKMLDRLKKSNVLLDLVQRGLNAYLEKKRLYFPRFFFLSNDELLEILSETKDPMRVQPHLKKCFEGIAKLTFTEDLVVTHMRSSEGEIVPLTITINTAAARGQVEKWLLELEKAMKACVHHEVGLSFDAYVEQPREQWVLLWPGQAVQCIAMTYWTLEVTEAIHINIPAMRAYWDKCNFQISKIVDLVRGELSLQNRITLGALVVLDVHARDVLMLLIELKVEVDNDFNWLSQIRYYWEEQEDEIKSMQLATRMINSTLMYGYEYLGNTGRLVVTPLTDRCFRTLFGALHLNLGGAPEGPAGTGKTETTKDLAKAVAKQCVVFNCSDGLDYIALGKFFKGLASCGAWSCFDEFNRIDLEVLSVVAQQILSIQRGINSGSTELLFEGTLLQLDKSCAVFITMNPGYAGRSELPDNLKALFRSVAMMVPDYVLISEIELYAFGYLDAKPLAVKIVATYKLCSEQLSSQCHYDYGMRAVKSVLRAAGALKLRYPDEVEDVILLRSIKDVNLPKFLEHDVPLFMGIIGDLFPGLPLPQAGLPHLVACLKEVCVPLNLQANDFFIEKVLQLYEMILVRHGLMLVGFPLSGKTKSYHALGAALASVSEKGLMDENAVEWIVINPKSITMGQLYGQFDPVSHEWSDGILAISYRAFAVSPNNNRKWLVFDGPVDAIWIENLNTVLDDNKKLCLMSGEIIQLAPTTNLVFEPMDLEAASPATVSRCGMIYMEPKGLGWKCLLESWLNTLPPTLHSVNKNLIRGLFNRFTSPLLWLVEYSKQVKQMYVTSRSNLVTSCMKLYDCFMDDFYDEKYVDSLSDLDVRAQLEGVFFFSCIWSLGATLEASGRAKFDMMFRGLLDKEFPEKVIEDLKYPREIAKPDKQYILTIPKEGLVFDYRYTKEGKGKWKPWQDDVIAAPPIGRDTPPNQILVTTLDSVRFLALFQLFVTHQKLVMMVGPTGTGKSSYIVDFLVKKVDTKIYKALIMAFSAQTNCNQTQDIIMGKLDKRRKGMFGPPIGCYCVVFVDDVSMPQAETYGAQPPIEVLRQGIDLGLWYDRKTNVAMHLVDVQFMCAMGKPTPGAKLVTPRFSRHFSFLCIDEFDEDTLKVIFNRIMVWHIENRGFPRDFDSCIFQIVNGTLEVYKQCRLNLLPTPAKSHYTFNLRDFSRVILGVLLSLPAAIPDEQSMKRLWVHENLRVFSDRLVEDADRQWIVTCLRDAMITYLDEDFDIILQHLLEPNEKGIKITDVHLRKLIYCDFANPKPDTRYYMETTDMDHLSATVDAFLAEFNNMSKKPMNLVLFRFAIEHVSRISRVLTQPRSHGLLVGLGGSGRQSLTRLSAHINEYDLFQVEMSRTYGKTEWREDLKTLLRKSSTPDLHMVFLFIESQIKEEGFLEDVNNMLNSGEVPNIFESDEKAEICEKMRVIDRQRDKSLQTDGSPTALYAYFVSIVRDQLHIVLAMSPAGTSLRTRIRKFPSLVNCCTIDWFQEWPPDALLAVATRFLKDIELTNLERETAIKLCQVFHTDTQELTRQFLLRLKRYNYVTPTAYLELINMFKSLLNRKRAELITGEKRYLTGLDQLAIAAKSVAALQKALEVLQPKLAAGAAAVALTTAKVEKEKEGVALVEADVLVDQAAAEEQAAAAQAIKEECDADLAEAMPILNSALAALDTLTPQDITFIKTMKSPPRGIKLVMEAICILKEMKPDKIPNPSGVGTIEDYWGPSKKLLNDIKFLEGLQNYDKDNIPPPVMKKLMTTIMLDEGFVPEKIRAVSVAAEGMCKWVIAMTKYDKVAKVVAPKKQKLAAAQAVYDRAMGALAIKQAQLKEIQDKLAKLEEALDEQKRQQKFLDDEVLDCSNKLKRAEMLISGLGGEKTRWTQIAKELRATYNTLTGDILVAAGIIAYLGPFTAAFRNTQIKSWAQDTHDCGIVCTLNYSVIKTLGEPVTIQQWNIDGLPSDDFSVESAIIIMAARRWPLMIDPQGQANRWIKTMEKANNLCICRLTQTNLGRVLENAVQFGQPVLLENVLEDLDPMLEPLLQQQTFRQGGALCIKIGDTVVEYNKDFKLYISTKLANPHYLPEVGVRVTLVNFMLARDGLVAQLLSRVVARERPDLQQAKLDLTTQSAEHRRLLQEIEKKILNVLSTSEHLLEDEEAVQILNSAKDMSNEIKEKQEVAMVTEKAIDEARDHYVPIAEHSTNLFFLIASLANIDPMYQYSLGWFEGLFVASIDNTEKVEEIPHRLQILRAYFTLSLYSNICRSLFEKDKMVFSLLLTITIMLAEGELEQPHVLFLMGGAQPRHVPPNPVHFLSPQNWTEFCGLNELPKFHGIYDHFMEHQDAWEAYCDTKDPQNQPLPAPWNTNLTLFEKLMVLRCMRLDMMVPAVQNFVEVTMGKSFIEPPLFDLASSYAESHCCIPLLFVLTPGSDPMGTLLKFADDQGFGASRLFSLSLGQGQGPIAVKLIDEGVRSGTWVVLQNCHLAKSWMPMLEKICEGLLPDTTHPDFRLWLTSYPADHFPVYVLQNGVKMTNEPPQGLRANIARSYQGDPINDPEWFEGNKQSANFKKLLFCLCFFHAVVQERRQFGPLGWNIRYEFNETDLRISVTQLYMFLNEYDDVQFVALRYLTGECNYGGRVTDDWDRRTLNTILYKFYNPLALDEKQYSLAPHPAYYVPTLNEHGEFIAFAFGLPVAAPPAVFGFHSNADITKHFREANELLDTAILTQDTMAAGGTGETPEEQAMAIAEDVLRRLPDKILSGPSHEGNIRPADMTPMSIVVIQEAARYERLVDVVRSSSRAVIGAVQGVSVLTDITEEVLTSMVRGRIPTLWIGKSYPSLKPLAAYVNDLLARLEFLQHWHTHGPPLIFWLSGFYFPQAFLTAAQQSYARKYKIPIDQLAFHYEVQKDQNKEKPPPEGVYVTGLFMEGARWNMQTYCVDESIPKVLYDEFPIIWLIPLKREDIPTDVFYNCPLYKTGDRRGVLSTTGHSTNYILFVRLPTKQDPDHWIMRGVALLTQLPF